MGRVVMTTHDGQEAWLSIEQQVINFTASVRDLTWVEKCPCGRVHRWATAAAVRPTGTLREDFVAGVDDDGEVLMGTRFVCACCGLTVKPGYREKPQAIQGARHVTGGFSKVGRQLGGSVKIEDHWPECAVKLYGRAWITLREFNMVAGEQIMTRYEFMMLDKATIVVVS